MSKKFLIQIILPSQLFLEDEVDMVNIPGLEGVFGVLPGHANLVAALGTGLLTISNDKQEKKVFVCGGVAKVDEKSLIVLTEFAIDLSLCSKTHVLNKIAEIKDQMVDYAHDSLEYIILTKSLNRHQALSNFV